MVISGMRRLLGWAIRPRPGVRVVGPALILAGIGLVVGGTLSVAAPAQQAGDESVALFGEMMPVFSSPRCANCHGGVNPVSGANHEPGPVADSTRLSNGDMGFDEQRVCQECHTAGTANWRTAPSNMGFVGKDTLTLCRQIRRTAGLSSGDADSGDAFVNHLASDDLIGVGFVGQGGIGEDSPFATITPDPPPMSRAEMVDAAKRWVGEGHAKCGANGWNGTITSTMTAQNHEDRQPGTLLVKDSATELKVVMAVVDSTATSNVSFIQHDFTDAPTGRPCWVIHYSWKADGRGDAELNIIGDTDEGGMFIAWSVPEYSGTAHSDMGTVPPACKIISRDEPYVVRKSNGGVQPKVDLDDPNHLAGEKVIEDPNNKTTTTIKWDLSREP
jgi:hypothetical protein